MKAVGIIGGFGPETSANFFMQIVSTWPKNLVTRPEILMWNAPVNVRLERKFISENGSHSHFRKLLIEGSKILQNSGAEFIVLPCNSLHVFSKEIMDSIHIPFLSIIDETASTLRSQHLKSVGILGNTAMAKNRLFLNPLKKLNIKEILPGKSDQKIISKIISDLVNFRTGQEDVQKVNQIIRHLEARGTDAILLACTDLQLLQLSSSVPIFDTLQILAGATVEKMLSK